MQSLLRTAECVLFDFDGPICRLFSARPAKEIAERLRTLADELGQAALLTPAVTETDDPLRVLRLISERANSHVAGLLEQALTEEELRAAPQAYPTQYADQLIQTLSATGRRLAITTNNSSLAVEQYLSSRRLGHLFAGHIHGRQPDTFRLKPDPDCLLRALDTTGTQADRALMIGDAPADVAAAESAMVPFLGYARNADKSEQLRAAGAHHIVSSLEEIVRLVHESFAASPGDGRVASATDPSPQE